MSSLKLNDDDHADAAGKHLGDAEVLFNNGRFDGAAYLAGYVAECCLKSVILHDVAFDPATRAHDPAKLQQEHSRLRKHPFGHKLSALAAVTIAGHAAKYATNLPSGASIQAWSEARRYAPPGFVAQPGTTIQQEAQSYYVWADYLYRQSVIRMKLDGVI